MSKTPLFIKRKIDTKIREYLKMPEILAIVGPRQSGKTTYLKNLIPEIGGKYISFEDVEILNLFNNDLKKFVEKYLLDTDILCIDEFQYAKQGGKNLKFIFDTYKNKKVIISGSSVIDITIHAIKFLVGRVIVVDFWPFDLDELKLVFPNYNSKQLLDYYSTFGGYPRVALSRDDQERKLILQNIYNTYFLREVRDILGLVDDYKIQKMLVFLANSVSSTLNYSALSSECGIKEREVRKYLEFINKSFVAYLVKPFYTNKFTEIVKQPKVYFYDAGFLNHVLSYEVDTGKKLEQVLVMELIKKKLDIKYWRNKQKNEMDFIVFKENKILTALEVKNSAKYTESFHTFVKKYPHILAQMVDQDNLFEIIKNIL